ncbi:MAG: alpha/beta fold hydrolase [Rhizobiaceae bacterium]
MNDEPDKPTVNERDVTIAAPKNWDLAATVFSHPAPQQEAPVVMISAAAGVPRWYYANFARYLVEQGAAAVLTYDYRGMCDSSGERSRWKELRMFHWAQYDFPACTNWLLEEYPNNPLVGMGHSYGGQALGLSGASQFFERYATVATMSGYWRDLDTPYQVWFLTQVMGRIASRTLGYVPKIISPGEPYPGKIMLDWADWIAQDDYWFSRKDVPGLENFEKVTLPYLSIRVTDDPWGNEKAIGEFMKHYTNADLRHALAVPGESGKIGHLGFFSRRHKESHWDLAADFLLDGQFPNTEI